MDKLKAAAMDVRSLETYQQSYKSAPCERCGGGRIDYRLTFDNGDVEHVCWCCCRTSLVLFPQATEKDWQ